MDDALAPHMVCPLCYTGTVLILVVMDDALALGSRKARTILGRS